jgi:hypothetical protein
MGDGFFPTRAGVHPIKVLITSSVTIVSGMLIPTFRPISTMTHNLSCFLVTMARGVGETYAQELIQEDMIQWVRDHADEPFFLFYAITLPHGRHEIDDYGLYEDMPWSDKQKAYAAQVTRIDSDVGELVDTLRLIGN